MPQKGGKCEEIWSEWKIMLGAFCDLVDSKENVMALNYSTMGLVQNCFKHSPHFSFFSSIFFSIPYFLAWPIQVASHIPLSPHCVNFSSHREHYSIFLSLRPFSRLVLSIPFYFLSHASGFSRTKVVYIKIVAEKMRNISNT